MLEQIKQEVISTLSRVEIRSQEEIAELERQQQMPTDMNFEHAALQHEAEASQVNEEPHPEGHKPFVRHDKKIGRNDPCYCGSGKKFKQCHGKLS